MDIKLVAAAAPGPTNTGRTIYPFRQMAVGQAFWVPRERELSLRQAAAKARVRHALRLTVRVEKGTARVWCYRIG